jgi:hypothetical protein
MATGSGLRQRITAVETIEGGPVSARELAFLAQDEKALFAARPSYATVNDGDHWNMPLLLVTDRRMVISKEKLFGKPKADFSAPWSELGPVAGELWNGWWSSDSTHCAMAKGQHRANCSTNIRYRNRVGNSIWIHGPLWRRSIVLIRSARRARFSSGHSRRSMRRTMSTDRRPRHERWREARNPQGDAENAGRQRVQARDRAATMKRPAENRRSA